MSHVPSPGPAGEQNDREIILFVDDDPINCESFSLCFQNDYTVLTATSGEEALDLFTRTPGISVVLSDQRMDGMSGVELLSKIYVINPDTVRIIITGYIDVSDIIDAVNRGHIYQYVLKPWDMVQMRLILEQAIHTWRLTLENHQLTRALREKNQQLTDANIHLRNSEEQLRSLSGALIHARENEQKRIALELHDELGQSLAALKLQIRLIEKEQAAETGGQDDGVLSRLHDVRGAIDEIIENVRRLSKNLSPIIIDDLGLDTAIDYLVQRFSDVYKIPCTFKGIPLGRLFPEESHLLIYRLLQGALGNAGKHSRADRVEVRFTADDDRVILRVQDNGIGISREEIENRPLEQRGIGMTVMAERVKMLGGEMNVDSARGGGTTVEFRLPIIVKSAEESGRDVNGK